MSQVWDLDLPHNELLILLAMTDHADHDGKNIYPSMGLIAWKTGYSERQVRRVVHKLVKSGVLVLVQEKLGSVKKYRFDVSKGVPKEAYRTEGRQNVTPDKAMSEGVGHSYDTPTPDKAMSYEPSVEPSVEPFADYAAIPKKHGRVLKEKEAKPYYDAIVVAWDIHKGQNADMQKMLEGKATKGVYAENNMNPPVSLEEFCAWSLWAKRTMGDYMVKSPAKVASSITSWRLKKQASDGGYISFPKVDDPTELTERAIAEIMKGM